MNKTKISIIILSAILSLFAFSSTVFASNTSMAGALKERVVEYTLPNGMTWLIVKNGTAPVFSGIAQVKVGGVDEEKGKTGLAHLLEHMAFKGTDDISPEGLWDAFITNGAVGLNAYTTKDVTAYYASMPSSKLELWMYLTSEMLKNSSMRDFQKERDVVLEELVGKMENDPERQMITKLSETAFELSPYKWPTIGFKDDVAGLEPGDLQAFKKKYYVPRRMVGSIAGNVDIEGTKALLLRYFGSIPDKKPAVQRFPVEPIQTKAKSATVKFDSSPMLYMAFHKPTVPSKDDHIFDLITYVMCVGDTSKLRKSLIFEKKLVRSIDCDSSYPGVRLDNLFVIGADPIEGKKYKDVERAIWEVVNALKEKGLTDAELKTVKNNVLKDFVFNLSRNEDLSHTLAYFQGIAGDWRYMLDQLSMIEKITSKDIVDVMNKYLNEGNMTVVELER